MLIKKTDDELQIAYGAVYVPDTLDSHGDFMRADEIRKMAHRFLASGKTKSVDLNHNHKTTGSSVVESYIAKTGDEDFTVPGTWVVGMHIPNKKLWQAIKKGDINGFSLEAVVRYKKDQVVDARVATTSKMVKGATNSVDGHSHEFEAFFDEKGNLTGGRTSVYKDKDGNEHFHIIRKPVVTDKSAGHAHRFAVTKGFVPCE